MKDIYVLTAPQGIGKTQKAEALAAKLGCQYIVDDWNGQDALRAGTLAITNQADFEIPLEAMVLEASNEADLDSLIATFSA